MHQPSFDRTDELYQQEEQCETIFGGTDHPNRQ